MTQSIFNPNEDTKINSLSESQRAIKEEESNPAPDVAAESSENFLQEFFQTGE